MSDSKSLDKRIYIGPFVHSKSLQQLEICTTGAIGVDEYGKIAFVERAAHNGQLLVMPPGFKDAKTIRLRDNSFLFPGFIDTHIHASQYPNTGIFGSSTLLDWLNTYTFPLESSYSDLQRAQRIYNRVVTRTLSHGTTTASYYATIHVPATNALADICIRRGQRAFVGRVCMDTMSPEYYRDESVEQAVSSTQACIDHCHQIDPEKALITPIITPRFAPSCTSDCLSALGALRKRTGLPVQTHISENQNEIKLVKELFPESKSYTNVYDTAGLLADRTILAHAVHLSDEEQLLIKERKSAISHCPASNTALTSGAAPIRDMLDKGIPVGLGTDVSGGFSPSILEMVRHAIWVSRHVAMTKGDRYKLSVEEALYLATRGGAQVVGLSDSIGAFEVGMQWDAQMVELDEVPGDDNGTEDKDLLPSDAGGVDIFGWESWEDKIHKWAFNGSDKNTQAVWVRGRLVHRTGNYTGSYKEKP